MKILITGATGNVGLSVLNSLTDRSNNLEVFAGVRNIENDKKKLKEYNVHTLKFDFENPETFQKTLSGIDVLFLLRPPQLANVSKVFKPLINAAIEADIKHIIFLSVQGVENSKIIPHNKIEQLIIKSKIAFTFLRPAYFMQNFTTSLRRDLIKNQRIYLPAGRTKFTLIDVNDIGAVTAKIVGEPQDHINKSYELTNNEILTFREMAGKLSEGTGKKIKYISPNLVQFYLTKRKENMPPMLIIVMIMLHYFPRFQKAPRTTDCVKYLIGREPITFDEFVSTNKLLLI